MCGRKEATYLVKVAGAKMIACPRCAEHGEIIDEIAEAPKPAEARRIERQKTQIVQKTEEIVENIGEIVRKKREELGLKQEDLGKKVSEHDSLIRRIEHGYIPDLGVARKLQKFLDVKLIEEVKASEQELTSNKSGGALTLGDIMVIRKKEPVK
jgi:putative transcription factor